MTSRSVFRRYFLYKNIPQVSEEEFAVRQTTLVKDLGPAIPEVEYNFFRHHILPPLHPSIDIDKIITRLQADKIIVNGRWQQFPEDPWTYAVKDNDECNVEHKVFANLEDVVHNVVERSGADSPKTLEYKSFPDYMSPFSFEEKKGPKASLVLSTAQDVPNPSWRDIVTPVEFKLQDRYGDLQDVRTVPCIYIVHSLIKLIGMLGHQPDLLGYAPDDAGRSAAPLCIRLHDREYADACLDAQQVRCRRL